MGMSRFYPGGHGLTLAPAGAICAVNAVTGPCFACAFLCDRLHEAHPHFNPGRGDESVSRLVSTQSAFSSSSIMAGLGDEAGSLNLLATRPDLSMRIIAPDPVAEYRFVVSPV